MRLAAAVLSSLAVASLAAAQPATLKDKGKPAAKQETKAKEPRAKKESEKGKQGEQKPAAAPKPNPVTDSYTAMPLAERLSIQNDLIWTGDYNGTVSGEFSERAIAAVKAFQKRTGVKETGVLNQPERTALAVSAKPKQDAVGWRMIDDIGSGARIGVPLKLAPQASQIIGGMRWTSSRGEVSVETFRITQPGTTLSAVFERMKKEPTGRKPDYSVFKPDFFVISGLQNLKKFYVRAQLRGEEVRGFTIQYDQAMAGTLEPVVVAMSSAYSAFPTGGTIAPPPRRKVEYASGVVVAPGTIVTNRDAIDGCYVVTVAGIGGADRVADGKGLALLRVYTGDLKAMALASEGKPSDVTLLGVADPQAQGGGGAVSAAKARVLDTLAIEPAPGLGFDGAAVLDAQGRLAGIAAFKFPLVAGTAPPPQATLTPVETIRAFLAEQKIAASGAAAGTEAAKGSVVRLICVRK